MMNLYDKAHEFATRAHAGQVRKYTGVPYIKHPEAVADIVARVTDNIEVIAAAVLHDVVEDCDVEFPEIEHLFGSRVRQLVNEVTDVSKPSDGNRAARKAIDRRHIAQASAEGKTIKLADLIDNSPSVIKHDPKFAKVYMHEKSLLLDTLILGGDPRLFDQAVKIVMDYYTENLLSEIRKEP